MQGKLPRTLLDRALPYPAPVEGREPREAADLSFEAPPSPREVLGEAALTIAAFLLIALALQMLAVWGGT
ncbi:hypothetical protein [Azospirillum sp. BE72]|uniref:hypothetical protein n=1 Tax=Azospirillum sp. BE72 TaxID=2817776 RepID=UPI0028666597|nr:hypothetical protein [Azospirillum sp. BE72]MDR6772886.1 hypothetical protein [Azospirillum sp. BE72]